MKINLDGFSEIPGFGGYLVNEFGVIYSKLSRKLRKTSIARNGYENVKLSVKGKKVEKGVARLVAETFIENPRDLPEVNHKDGIKRNNHVSNLEWVTSSENILHTFRCLGRTANKPWLGKFGAEHHAAVALIGENKKTGEIIRFDSSADARRAGLHVSNIYKVINGKRKSYRGCSWRRECQG